MFFFGCLHNKKNYKCIRAKSEDKVHKKILFYFARLIGAVKTLTSFSFVPQKYVFV